jgi:hypothetical protein
VSLTEALPGRRARTVKVRKSARLLRSMKTPAKKVAVALGGWVRPLRRWKALYSGTFRAAWTEPEQPALEQRQLQRRAHRSEPRQGQPDPQQRRQVSQQQVIRWEAAAFQSRPLCPVGSTPGEPKASTAENAMSLPDRPPRPEPAGVTKSL